MSVCSKHPRTSSVQFLQFLSSMHLYCIFFALAVCFQCIACCEQRQSCGDDGLPPVFLAVPYQQYYSTQAITLQQSLGTRAQGPEPGARSDSSSTVQLDSRQGPHHTSTLNKQTGTTTTSDAAAVRQLISTETPQGSVSRVTVAGLGMASSGTSSTSSSNSGSGGFNQPEQIAATSTTGGSQNVVNGFAIPTEQAFHTKADYSAVGAPRAVAGLVLLLSVAALWVLNL